MGSPTPSLLVEEIKCYGLPYGLVGFISHLLTVYTVINIMRGYEPFRPWNRTTGSTIGLTLSVLSFASSAIALRTVIECRSHWQLVLTGLWKFILSLTSSAISLSSAWFFWRHEKANPPPKSDKSWWHYRRLVTFAVGDKDAQDAIWNRRYTFEHQGGNFDPDRAAISGVPALRFLYPIGIVLGLIGQIALVKDNWHLDKSVRTITYVFIAPAVIGTYVVQGLGEAVSFYWNSLVAAMWADWVIGAMAHNLIGAPTGEEATLYWIYFAAERLTMFA